MHPGQVGTKSGATQDVFVGGLQDNGTMFQVDKT